MKTILITGFKPFLSNKENPTQTLVEALIKKGYKGKVLDVSYKKDEEFFSLLKDDNYDFILSFGLASNRKKISLERYAYNQKNTSTKDEDGFIPAKEDNKIDPYLPDVLSTSIDVTSLNDKLNKAGYPCYISEDPGRYLCNYVYFKALKRQSGQALFIHLPQEDETFSSLNNIKMAEEVIGFLLNL